MKRIALLSVLCMLSLGLRGQHELRAVGPMPEDLKKGFEAMYEVDKQRVKDFDQGRLRNKNDVQGATYAVNALLTSGRVLYGDALTQWVNRIADTLLVNDPELRKELRFYVVKSPEVNAYATGQGIIFVNLGLIAQIEDEAQLAYILSHEIVHYTQKHTLQELTRNKRAEARLGGSDEVSALMRKHNRSKEMENEADSLGIMQFYLPSGYSKEVCEGVFDVLQYAYLPFDEVPFDTTLFNTAHFRLPSELWLKETHPITARDDYDDSRSTHPNILKRRQLVQGLFDEYEGSPRSERFLCASAGEFRQLRDMARYEVMRLHLIDFNYARALYEVYLLELEHPEDSAYLRQCRAQTLYSMARYRNHSKAKSNCIPDPEEIEGEQQRVYHMLHGIPKEYLTIIALREQFLLGNSAEAEELMRDLKDVCGLSAKDFLSTFDSAAPAPAQDTAASSKYSRIRKKKSETRQANPITYAFEGQPLLIERMAEVMAAPKDTAAPAAKSERVLLLDPTYLIYNARADRMDYPKSVAQEARLADLCRTTLQANGQELVTLDDSTTQGYNDFMALTEYVEELSSCLDDYEQRLFTQPQADSALDRAGCDQLQLLAVANIENLHNGNFSGSDLIFAPWVILAYPTLPVVLHNRATSHEQTLMAVYNIDARHGRLLSQQKLNASQRDDDSYLKSHLYATQREATQPGKKTPGYLGRRLMVGADLTLNPNGCINIFNNHWLGLCVTPTAEYVLGPRSCLRLSGTYKHNQDVHECDRYEAPYYHWYDDTSTAGTLLLTLNFTRYKEGCLAPLGPYLSYGLTVAHTNVSSQIYPEEPLAKTTFGLNVEAGRHYILFDRLTLNAALTTNLFATWPFLRDPFGDTARGDKYLNRLPGHYLTFNNFIGLKLGLGLLPF